MARALSALRATRDHGASGLLLISGPAGIGKTAVLREICQQATRMNVRVASAKCDHIEQVSPGAPVIAALRAGHDPLVAEREYETIVKAAGEPLLLAERIASSLERAAAAGPVLIAIDDLQWADRVSRFLLRTLVPRLIGMPVMWLFASREQEIAADLAGYEPVHVEDLRLTPLTAPDLVAVARDRLGHPPDPAIREYLDASGGNPLLATQIIDGFVRTAASGEAGTAVAEFAIAVGRRLAGLGAVAGDLVRLVAVAGRPMPLRDASALLPTLQSPEGEAAVGLAVESGLLTASGSGLAVRHDLVAESVYATMSGEHTRRLHALFADHHLALGDPFLAAGHARAAATPGDLSSARTLISAAEALAGVSADDAAELAALAFRTVGPAQPEWLDLGLRCLGVLCRTERATETIAVANQILARVDDANLAGQVETEAASALWLSGRVDELTARIERTLATAGMDESVTARLRAAYALARTRVLPGAQAAEEAAAAGEAARRSGDREALELALRAAGEAARTEGHHRLALRHFRELSALTGVSHLAEEIAALQFLDRYDHAQVLLDQARTDGRNDTAALLPALGCAQMWQDFKLGRLDDADASARSVIELGYQLGTSLHILDAISIRTAVALMRGDVEAAETLLRPADTMTTADAGIRDPSIAVMRGWLAASGSDLRAALEILRPVVDGAERTRSFWALWPCWNGLLFQIGAVAGDDRFTATCVDLAETAAARNPGVASFEGVALNLRGLHKKDLDILADAVQVLQHSPRPVLRGVGAESYGRALLLAGRRADGIAWLDRAWDEFHAIGATGFRADVQRVLRGAGVRLAKWPPAVAAPATGWASLTDAERRVAGLIGGGHTNKAAASALGVSVNTVGTHLRSIFTKLGVQSRVQLANMLRDQTGQ